LESKSCPFHGVFPICENSKTKDPVTGAAKQMASFFSTSFGGRCVVLED
jgi:hypothetical protein